ncbi:MAG: sucrase ferredoxin [Nostocoides sp.]
MEDFRCSTSTRARGDAVGGTASAITAVLLMEDPGPYGYTAWADARLPAGLGASIIARGKAAGVRPQLIRRDKRLVDGRRRVFLAYAGADGPAWVESTVISDPRDVLDLDLTTLAAGTSLGLDRWTEPVVAVCTHGKHDRCCAERGRPVYAAMSAAAADLVWQTSHLGGDRFSGNALALVGGQHRGAFLFGELDPCVGADVVTTFAEGQLSLANLRGRTCWPKPVQAAEIGLRLHLGLAGLGGVEVVTHHDAGSDDPASAAVVDFCVDDSLWRVWVEHSVSEPVRLSCHKDTLEPAVSWRVSSLAPVAA